MTAAGRQDGRLRGEPPARLPAGITPGARGIASGVPVVALALLGVLLASATAQVWLQSRAARASRFRLFGDRRFSPEWWSGWLVLAGFVCAVTGPVAHLLGLAVPIAVLDRWPVQVAGIVLWCAAAALARASQVMLGGSWRIGVVPGEREVLVLRGPYRVVRHPMYTALVALLAAGALVDPTWVAVSAPPLALAGWEILVRRVEEPHLMAAHPAYAAYRSHVGRFVPVAGRVKPAR